MTKWKNIAKLAGASLGTGAVIGLASWIFGLPWWVAAGFSVAATFLWACVWDTHELEVEDERR
ncbi:hypothetical protein [Pseudoxanthomonas winnipegensis]|uniref:hypothetical protein n=1 Tax=Pseudoxanthomonas winnipegensis TaxID=2480810 RepID=UPI00102E0657|nr:hypothetical protein [Pseudoxanthomonas winnipegensis]RZZ85641.1 hypothetical protein EA663_11560 [Pseudoxanthomonas winnipegensis]